MKKHKYSQERKSGIYMDRTNGKLPMDRVKGYYQESNAFTRTFGSPSKFLGDVGSSIAGDAKAAYNKFAKPAVDAVSGFASRNFGGLGGTIKQQVKSDAKAVKKKLS